MGDTHAWGRDKAGQPDIINSKSDILLLMSAIGGKADVREQPSECLLIARSGHSRIPAQASELFRYSPITANSCK